MNEKIISQLFEEFHIPKHVKRHCETVADFAFMLGKKIVERGTKLDVELVRRSALLHDLVRIVDFKKFEPENFPDHYENDDLIFWLELRKKYAGRHHADVCSEILVEKKWNEEARIIKQHGFLQIQKGFDSLEAKLLYYADKRVKHDKVTELQDRLDDGKVRNGLEVANKKISIELDKKVHLLEDEILSLAGITLP